MPILLDTYTALCVYLVMKNEIKKKGNEMTYEEYLDLLNEEDTDENAGNYLNMSDSDAEAMNAALEDMDEAEEEFVSETVASYMVYGGA